MREVGVGEGEINGKGVGGVLREGSFKIAVQHFVSEFREFEKLMGSLDLCNSPSCYADV